MKKREYGIVFFVALNCFVASQGRPATIIWGTHEGAGARTFDCTPLEGTRVPGGPVNLANGDLIQLIKGVGAIDNPYPGGVPDPAYWIDPNYAVDDIILDEVHAGYGLGPPGTAANGEWSRTVDVDIAVGDVLYARAYSDSKDNFSWITEMIVGSGGPGEVLSQTVTQVVNPETYYFDNLGCVPEPFPLTFMIPGLTVWTLRKVKGKRRRASAETSGDAT